jgi:Fic family protein
VDLKGDPVSYALKSVADLHANWQEQLLQFQDSDRLLKFLEQLKREWSIETGIIENLYDIERGVTQTLIEHGFQVSYLPHGAANKDPEYVIALLEDQRNALEGLFAFVKQERHLTTGYIKEVHAAMTRSQETTTAIDPQGNVVEVPLLRGDWKRHPNYPRRNGTVYRYCPPEHVAAEMERLVEMHQRHTEEGIAPEVEAAWIHHRFSQIHPFQDGNGRVARLLATLVLIRAGLFPMVVPRDEKDVYIQTLELADGGDIRPLILLTARRQAAIYDKAVASLRKADPVEGI